MMDERLSQEKNYAPLKVTIANAPSGHAPTPTVKKLTWEEMRWRREKGICFNCDELFTTGHKCRAPILLMVEANQFNNFSEEAFEHNIDKNFYVNPEVKVRLDGGTSDRSRT